MSIVNTLSLESNRQIKINFDVGDLSLLFTCCNLYNFLYEH